jgi:putative peptidoglycan lipid II flippase
VREVLRLAPPMLVGSAVVNVNTLVDRAVGSAQGEGTIAALNFGVAHRHAGGHPHRRRRRLSALPRLQRVGRTERRAELRELVSRSLRLMLVLLTPMVALLVIAAEPIVALVFGRGDFDATAVRLTSIAVLAYAVSAVGIGVRQIASRACFAVGDSRTPVAVATFSMVLNVVGDLTLGVAYGIPGLAASTSLSLVVGAGLLVLLLSRRHAAVSLPSVGGPRYGSRSLRAWRRD